MNKKNNVYLMYVIVFLQGFVFYGPIATLYRQSRGINMYEIFIIESISWIMMIVFEIPWGWFADRFGYRRTIILANGIFFISKIVFYEAHSFDMFLLERILIAMALSGLSGCDIALLYSSSKSEDTERMFGIYSAASTAGFLIASFMSTWIVGVSMDFAALLTIPPYLISVLVSLFLVEIEIDKEIRPRLTSSIKLALSSKTLVLLVLSIALASEVVQASTVFLNQLQYLKSGINIKYFGVLICVIQIARLSSAKAYMLTMRFGKYNSMAVLCGAITCSVLVLIFTENGMISFLCILIMAVSMALLLPIQQEIVNATIATVDRATILSVYAMLGDVASVIVNPIIGKAANNSVRTAFMACFIICILMCILFGWYVYVSSKHRRALEAVE